MAPQVAVARLRLRGPPSLAARATARMEEALRLAAPEGERLLVLRRLPLGRLPVTGGAALWDARAAAALRAGSARAVHALFPGAAATEAVWFASAAEARILLLRALATGRRVDAWFWRLAVPDWRGAALPEWVPRLLAQALADPEAEAALARAVWHLAEAGHLAPFVHALAFAPEPPRAPPRPVAPTPLHAAARPTAEAALPRLATQLLARHPPLPRARLLAAIRTAPAKSRASRWLARLALLAVAPEAATQPVLLAAMVEAVVIDVAPEVQRAPSDPAPAAPAPPALPRRAALAASPEPPAPRRAADTPREVPRIAPTLRPDSMPQHARPLPRTPAPAEEAAQPAIAGECRTRAGGVLLLVTPLARMGLPAWLDRHPDLAAAGFARALLRHVALRQRIPPEDPLLVLLGEDRIAHPALDAWRVGLDRWLRRRTRRGLAAVARRGGWLTSAEDRLVLRFPLEAADLNLRRLALDVDPGWVPWLGLAIRYHFRDHPVP